MSVNILLVTALGLTSCIILSFAAVTSVFLSRDAL